MTDEIILRFSVKDDGSPIIERVNQKINQTAKESKALVPGLESARQGLTGFIGANAGAIAILVGVGAALGKALDKTMQYAGEVRDLTLATDGNAEASSRLLQVLDDYEITSADVTAGMRAMKEQGIVPTVDALATLSDQFLAIADPAERLKFAQDNLGRSSAKFLNVLSQGGDKIRELNAGISESLILTDADIEKTEEARLAFDAWGDAVQGVQTDLTIGMLPALTDIMNVTNDWKRAEQLAAAEGKDLWMVGLGEAQSFIELAKAERHATAASQENTEATTEQTVATEEMTKAAAAANANIIQGAIEATKANDDYRKSQADIREQMKELNAEKQAMYPWERDQIQETQAKIDELSVTYEENAAAYVEAMETKFAMMAVEKIEMSDGLAGFTDAEFAKAQAVLKTTDIATAAAFEQTQAMDLITSALADGTISAQAYGAITKTVMKDGVVTLGEVQAAMDSQLDAITESFNDPIGKMTQANEKLHALQNMAGEMWTYYVSIETTGSFPNIPSGTGTGAAGPAGPGGVGGTGVGGQYSQYAVGGMVVGPGSGTSDSIMARVSAGEFVVRANAVQQPGMLDLLNSINAGQMPGRGGGIVINGPVYVTANDGEEFMLSLSEL